MQENYNAIIQLYSITLQLLYIYLASRRESAEGRFPDGGNQILCKKKDRSKLKAGHFFDIILLQLSVLQMNSAVFWNTVGTFD